MRPALLALLLAASAAAQPAMRDADRVRLAEAFRLAADVQEALWPGWSEVPFAVLLVTPDAEFLVGHPRPPDDFAPAARDTLLGAVFVRPRQLPPTLLATFPVGGVSTVIVGTPEATGLASTAWVVTLLHEHVHQMQAHAPGYYAATDALGLAGGDTTGMWMLTYPFPYTSPVVGARFVAYRDALAGALAARYRPDADAARDTLDAARERLRDALSDADARYLDFQQWQEGVARDTERRVADAAADRHDPLPAFAVLPYAEPYAAVARTQRRALADALATADLAAWGRAAFYVTGAAEALLLDAEAPGWRRRYLADRFTLAPARARP